MTTTINNTETVARNMAKIIETATRLGFQPNHPKRVEGEPCVLRYSYGDRKDLHGNVVRYVAMARLEIEIVFYHPEDINSAHAQLTWVKDHKNFAMVPFDITGVGEREKLEYGPVLMQYLEKVLREYKGRSHFLLDLSNI